MAQFLTPEIADHYLTALQGPPISERITLRMEAVIEEQPTQMIFSCRSILPEAVRMCLVERGLFDPHVHEFVVELAYVNVCYPDDALFEELFSWSRDAYGCGLITQPCIER